MNDIQRQGIYFLRLAFESEDGFNPGMLRLWKVSERTPALYRVKGHTPLSYGMLKPHFGVTTNLVRIGNIVARSGAIRSNSGELSVHLM